MDLGTAIVVSTGIVTSVSPIIIAVVKYVPNRSAKVCALHHSMEKGVDDLCKDVKDGFAELHEKSNKVITDVAYIRGKIDNGGVKP